MGWIVAAVAHCLTSYYDGNPPGRAFSGLFTNVSHTPRTEWIMDINTHCNSLLGHNRSQRWICYKALSIFYMQSLDSLFLVISPPLQLRPSRWGWDSQSPLPSGSFLTLRTFAPFLSPWQLHPAWPLHTHTWALVNGRSRAWGRAPFPSLSRSSLSLTVPSRFTLPWGTCKVLESHSHGFEPGLFCIKLWDLGLKCPSL